LAIELTTTSNAFQYFHDTTSLENFTIRWLNPFYLDAQNLTENLTFLGEHFTEGKLSASHKTKMAQNSDSYF